MLFCQFTLRDCLLRQIFYTEQISKPTFTPSQMFDFDCLTLQGKTCCSVGLRWGTASCLGPSLFLSLLSFSFLFMMLKGFGIGCDKDYKYCDGSAENDKLTMIVTRTSRDTDSLWHAKIVKIAKQLNPRRLIKLDTSVKPGETNVLSLFYSWFLLNPLQSALTGW